MTQKLSSLGSTFHPTAIIKAVHSCSDLFFFCIQTSAISLIFSPLALSTCLKVIFFLAIFCVWLHQNQFLAGETASVRINRGINWEKVRNGISQLPHQRIAIDRAFLGESHLLVEMVQVDCEDISYWYKFWECLLAWPGTAPTRWAYRSDQSVCVVQCSHSELTGLCMDGLACWGYLYLLPGVRIFTGNPASLHIPFPFSLHIGFTAQYRTCSL